MDQIEFYLTYTNTMYRFRINTTFIDFRMFSVGNFRHDRKYYTSLDREMSIMIYRRYNVRIYESKVRNH